MGRSEGAVTRLVRSTLNLSLDDVNRRLLQAGEKALDASSLAKRRNYIRAKDTGNEKHAAKSQPAAMNGPSGPKPRPNTLAALVYELPYEMDVKDVVERAKAKGFRQASKSSVYYVRNKYPKSPSSSLTRVNPIASPEFMREQDARARLAAHESTTVPPSIFVNLAEAMPNRDSDPAAEVMMMVWRHGLEYTESVVRACRVHYDAMQSALRGNKVKDQ